jgi:hypothetical protein
MSNEERRQNFSINGYSPKRVVDLSVATGENERWYEVKTGGPFSILFNPEEKTWLKTVNDEKFDSRIEQSYQAQLAMLHLIGADLLAEKCDLVEINNSNCAEFKERKGFVSPHFGETIQSVIKSKKKGVESNFSDEDLNWLYYQGFLLAKQFLKESGWMMNDPNSGNLVIADKKLKVGSEIILIDFSNKNSKRKCNGEALIDLENDFDRQAKKAGLVGWKK